MASRTFLETQHDQVIMAPQPPQIRIIRHSRLTREIFSMSRRMQTLEHLASMTIHSDKALNKIKKRTRSLIGQMIRLLEVKLSTNLLRTLGTYSDVISLPDQLKNQLSNNNSLLRMTSWAWGGVAVMAVASADSLISNSWYPLKHISPPVAPMI